MAGSVFTPYSTIEPFFGGLVSWVPPEDQQRITAYQVYQEIYWNHPQTFKLVARGADEMPIYIPSGRIIVDTTARYVAKKLRVVVSPDVGTPAEVLLAQQSFDTLFARERFLARFNSQKKQGLINGDWLWHITADATKLPGTRISIRHVDPAAYFPIYDGGNLDRIIKVHLAEQFVDNVQNKTFVKRQTYEKTDTGGILSSSGIFEVKDWWLSTSPVQVLIPPTLLPPQITQIPVYHIKNREEDGNPFGSSEIRGLERVMAAMNQGMSDEDIALALEGLGVYASDSGKPIDEDTGEPVDWIIGPGRVVENALNFRRVSGIGSVQPYGDHINLLNTFLNEAAGTTDAARGKVDVQVAESGISLALQLAPMLAKVDDQNQTIIDVHTQMFFDLKAWFSAYEQANFPDTEIKPVFGNPLPVNVKELLANIVMMMSTTPPLMSATTARDRLREAGVEFAPDELVRIAQEAQLTASLAPATADPFAARSAQELAGQNGAGA